MLTMQLRRLKVAAQDIEALDRRMAERLGPYTMRHYAARSPDTLKTEDDGQV
jgi:hypothetical protein